MPSKKPATSVRRPPTTPAAKPRAAAASTVDAVREIDERSRRYERPPGVEAPPARGLRPMKGRIVGGERVGERMTRVTTLYLTPEVADELKIRAIRRGMSASRVADEVLAEAFGLELPEVAE